jgi:hypothetical protein
MAKIIKNTVNSVFLVDDTGVSISALSNYTIPPQDYWIWAASSNVVSLVGNGTFIVNDGSNDLSISDGIDIIKGLFPAKVKVEPSPNQILIVRDDDTIAVLERIAAVSGGGGVSIFKKNEVAVSTRNEFDVANTTYTVTTGKDFYITSFTASYDAQASLYVRVKKQTGGIGTWETQFRLNMMSGGQGNSTLTYPFGNGLKIGTAGDIIKITVESSIAKGTIFASFGGVEI